ncbi:hypothetical protein HKD37_09G025257 [Glycine soja]
MCSQVEIQQENLPQVNIPLLQVVLFTNTSSTVVWKPFHGYMMFMEFLPKKRKKKEDVFFLTY